MPNAVLHIGVYPSTHPPTLKNLAFVHCDCDQYESIKSVITRMYPLLVERGIMLFDDYPYLTGARMAVDEFFFRGQLQKLGERYYVVKGHSKMSQSENLFIPGEGAEASDPAESNIEELKLRVAALEKSVARLIAFLPWLDRHAHK